MNLHRMFNVYSRAIALMAPPRASSSVIATPNDFQRSPYAQPAPLDLTSKSGLLLYTDAQEALKVPFNRKAANVQPLLNSLALEVKKFCLDSAVEVTNAAGEKINLLTHHGSFSDTNATAFFNTIRHEQITGITIGTTGEFSTEDTPRQIDLRALGSPTFMPQSKEVLPKKGKKKKQSGNLLNRKLRCRYDESVSQLCYEKIHLVLFLLSKNLNLQ